VSITGEHFGIVLSHQDRPGVSHGHPLHQRHSFGDARELSTAVTDPISRSGIGTSLPLNTASTKVGSPPQPAIRPGCPECRFRGIAAVWDVRGLTGQIDPTRALNVRAWNGSSCPVPVIAWHWRIRFNGEAALDWHGRLALHYRSGARKRHSLGQELAVLIAHWNSA